MVERFGVHPKRHTADASAPEGANGLASSSTERTSSMPISGTDPQLLEALTDLWESTDEAKDEGFPIPSAAALSNAERLLKAMFEVQPQRFEVYPTQDGEIAIDAPSGRGSSVILLCASDGGALWFGQHERDSSTQALLHD